MPFQSGPRIKRSAHVVRSQIVHRAHKRREARVSGIQPKINETSLQCQEGTNRAVASHNLWAKESMQDSEIARNKCDAAGIARVRKSLGEGQIGRASCRERV